VIRVDLEGWSATSLELAAPFSLPNSLTVYNGKVYIISKTELRIAIVEEETFTETLDSPVLVSAAPFSSWNINQYDGVRTFPSLAIFI
jgi:hypothetical protein